MIEMKIKKIHFIYTEFLQSIELLIFSRLFSVDWELEHWLLEAESMVDHYSDHRIDISLFSHLVSESSVDNTQELTMNNIKRLT